MGLSLSQSSRKSKLQHDPRNTQWANDFSQFGHQQLLKMGWKPGRGLGSSVEGIKEHIKVKHKVDAKGLGYRAQPDIPTGLDDFQRLLGKLNGNEQEVNENIERKARLAGGLYMNFVRGEVLGGENPEENSESKPANSKTDSQTDVDASTEASTKAETKSSNKHKSDKKSKSRKGSEKSRKSSEKSKKKAERAAEKLKKKELKAQKKALKEKKSKDKSKSKSKSKTNSDSESENTSKSEVIPPQSKPVDQQPKVAPRGIRATRNKYIAMKRQATMDEKGLKEILMI